ncbi:MAG: mechanosensitive ion channel [Sulfurimonadaceae bacterium]|jgi:small-conductance mechanosensitive channel|nr:mechanosensitive ion channel [Sulfurimonadaceae bacterium]
MKKVLLLLLFCLIVFAAPVEKQIKLSKAEIEKIEHAIEVEKKERTAKYIKEIEQLEKEIKKEQVWMKSYASYLTSLEVRESLTNIKKRIDFLSKKARTVNESDELSALISKEKIITSQIEQLKEKDSAPFSKLLTPLDIEKIEPITNPFDIFVGISSIKTLGNDLQDYKKRKSNLTELIKLLYKERELYKNVLELDANEAYQMEYQEVEKRLERFETALDTITVTAEVYEKRLEIIELNINKEIEVQMYKLINIGIIVLVIFLIFFSLKTIVKKYITDHERFYMANKIINFVNVTLIILIVFFSYIENVGYLVTILGFASAGIAIAMKDWFMSILGWLVIVFSGTIHVGDRIRVEMEGVEYVGDIMDISLLRMTLFEDVTLTTYIKNRRAGRIIFIPNNYIFTRMIANYSHSSLKTVWDGIDIVVTFESNHKKAMYICKEITKKYSKGYTDITRKQLNKIRNHYSLKNTNVEPRIFSFIEPHGVVISSWYLTNAYATLTLRSVISTEIVEAFNKEDDITIAYPTQRLHVQREKPKQPFHEELES